MTHTIETLNSRIAAEFAAAGEDHLYRTDRPLYAEVDEDGRVWLNDHATRIELTVEEALEGGIEQIVRDWLNATA